MAVTNHLAPRIDQELADRLLTYIADRAPAWVPSPEISRNVASTHGKTTRNALSALLARRAIEDKYEAWGARQNITRMYRKVGT